MTDFTSSLYLGLRHASGSLRPWPRLTTGVPSALHTPPMSSAIAAQLAKLAGTERATLCRSTLHAFWDLFLVLRERNTAIYLDASAYPIAKWGVERAACSGTPVRIFRHHDSADLRGQMMRDASAGRRPLVVADGFCTGCARFAPINHYLVQARSRGGMLVLDDTQAFGIFGRTLSVEHPYGIGGGGSLQAHAIADPNIIVVNSMAKGFGVPMAMVAGSSARISAFERQSGTQVHSSPPSFADLHAAESALMINRRAGDAIRSRLTILIRRFRRELHDAGIRVVNSLFPLQTLRPGDDRRSAELHRRLRHLGVGAVLHRPGCQPGAAVSFIITASHTAADIDRAAHAVIYARRMHRPALEMRRACG